MKYSLAFAPDGRRGGGGGEVGTEIFDENFLCEISWLTGDNFLDQGRVLMEI